MVAAGLCIGMDGVGHVIPPYFIPPYTKINTACFQDMLRSYYDPCTKSFCGADAVFEQDGAPSHAARTARVLLGEMFRETLSWPALSPDVSPPLRFVEFMEVSCRPREPIGRHDYAQP